MQEMIARILERYGTELKLCRGKTEYELRAFFQPVRSKSWSYLEGEYSPLGEVPRGQYVYIGPVDPAAEVGDSLKVGTRGYWIRRTELIRDADGPVYCWGMCVEKGGADTWGQSSAT